MGVRISPPVQKNKHYLHDSVRTELTGKLIRKIMSKFKTYLNETSNELFHKVSWPSWSELQSSAIIVAVASAIIALIVWLMDFGFEKLMDSIYHLFQ